MSAIRLLVAALLIVISSQPIFACFSTCASGFVSINSGCVSKSSSSTWYLYNTTGYTSTCAWPGWRSTRCDVYTLNYTCRIRTYLTNNRCSGEPDSDDTYTYGVLATRDIAC